MDPARGFDLEDAVKILEHSHLLVSEEAADGAEGNLRSVRVSIMRLAVEDAFRDAQLPDEARLGDASPVTRHEMDADEVHAHCLRGPLRKLPGGRMIIRGARLLSSAMRRFEEMRADDEVNPMTIVFHLDVNWRDAFEGVSRTHGGAFDLPGYDPASGQLQVKQALKLWRGAVPRGAAGHSSTPTAASSIAPSSISLSNAPGVGPATSAGVRPSFEADVVAFRATLDRGAAADDADDPSAAAASTSLVSPGLVSVAGPEAAPGTVPAGSSCALAPADALTDAPSPAPATTTASPTSPSAAAPPAAPPLTRADTAYKRRGLSAEGLACFLEHFGLLLSRLPGGRAQAVALLDHAIQEEPMAEDHGDEGTALLGSRMAKLEGGGVEWRVCGSPGIRSVLRRFNVSADAAMDGHGQTTTEMAAALPLAAADEEATEEEAAEAEAFLAEAEEEARREREEAEAATAVLAAAEKAAAGAPAEAGLGHVSEDDAGLLSFDEGEDAERDAEAAAAVEPEGSATTAAGSGADEQASAVGSAAVTATGAAAAGGQGTTDAVAGTGDAADAGAPLRQSRAGRVAKASVRRLVADLSDDSARDSPQLTPAGVRTPVGGSKAKSAVSSAVLKEALPDASAVEGQSERLLRDAEARAAGAEARAAGAEARAAAAEARAAEQARAAAKALEAAREERRAVEAEREAAAKERTALAERLASLEASGAQKGGCCAVM